MGRKGKKKQFWLSDERVDDLSVKAKRSCMTEADLVRALLREYPGSVSGD